MEGLIVADTDVIIDFFADISPYSKFIMELIQEGNLAITSVSVFELYAGVIGRRRLKQIEDFVRSVYLFPLNTIEAAAAAKIYTELKSKGKLTSIQDILIAGICVVNSLPLLTRNVAHFSAIIYLKIVSV